MFRVSWVYGYPRFAVMIVVLSVEHASAGLIHGSAYNWIGRLHVRNSWLATIGDRGGFCRVGLQRDRQRQSHNHRGGSEEEPNRSIGFRACQESQCWDYAS